MTPTRKSRLRVCGTPKSARLRTREVSANPIAASLVSASVAIDWVGAALRVPRCDAREVRGGNLLGAHARLRAMEAAEAAGGFETWD